MPRYHLKKDPIDQRDKLFSFNLVVNPHATVKLPRIVDLRSKMPPVYDQGELGSCTANAGCAYWSYIFPVKGLQPSRLCLYEEERILEGTVNEDAGASMRDIGRALSKFGVCDESLFPYVVSDFCKPMTPVAVNDALKNKIRTYSAISSLTDIKNCLALSQKPVLIGMNIYPSFETLRVSKTGIVPLPSRSERLLGGHAVLVVGYNDDVSSPIRGGSLIVRNSWGAGWGDKGYFYLPYSYLSSGYAYDFWTLSM